MSSTREAQSPVESDEEFLRREAEYQTERSDRLDSLKRIKANIEKRFGK